uniref:Uncharacterized protein n=1 Tax=Rhizophora mucronata TaxID=61149 RepID=A0A2P2PQ44_RHIMU
MWQISNQNLNVHHNSNMSIDVCTLLKWTAYCAFFFHLI